MATESCGMRTLQLKKNNQKGVKNCCQFFKNEKMTIFLFFFKNENFRPQKSHIRDVLNVRILVVQVESSKVLEKLAYSSTCSFFCCGCSLLYFLKKII